MQLLTAASAFGYFLIGVISGAVLLLSLVLCVWVPTDEGDERED